VKQSGSYTVIVSDTNDCGAISSPINVVVHLLPTPVITASGPLTFCEGDSVLLDAGADYDLYSWSGGQTSRYITVKSSGVYSVTVRDVNGCSALSPAVNVNVNSRPNPMITVNGRIQFCEGGSTELDAGDGYKSYQWSSGETTQRITVTKSGNYYVRVFNSFDCEALSQVVQITVFNKPTPVIVPDGPITFCEGGKVMLDGGAGYSSYLWSNGEKTQRIEVKTSGSFSVEVLDGNGCSAVSPAVLVTVHTNPKPVITVLGTTSFCSGDSVVLDAGSGFTRYRWSNGETTQRIAAKISGSYTVETDYATGCQGISPAIDVTVFVKPVPLITPMGPTTFCDGDSVELRAQAGFASYLWSTGSGKESIVIKSSGTYNVTVVDSNGCVGTSQSIDVQVHPLPAIPSITQVRDSLFSSPETSYQWLLDGLPISGATSKSVRVIRSGVYSVRVTNIFGCSSLSASLSLTVAETSIELPVIEAEPGERVHIPLTLGASKNLTLAGAKRFQAVVRFDENILLPIGQEGIWTEDGDERVLTLQGEWKDTVGTLAAFECLAMLGKISEAPLRLEFFRWEDGAVSVTTTNGLFRLKICHQGGDRLFDGDAIVRLRQNRPNPFNATTIIEYSVIESGTTKLYVTDLLGRIVHILYDGIALPGKYSVLFDAASLPSGMYFSVLETPSSIQHKAMHVLK